MLAMRDCWSIEIWLLWVAWGWEESYTARGEGSIRFQSHSWSVWISGDTEGCKRNLYETVAPISASCHEFEEDQKAYDEVRIEMSYTQTKSLPPEVACWRSEDVVKVISEWADYYNTDRYQWNLARLSPNEFYEYCLTGVYPLTIPPAKGCGSDEE